MNFEYESQGGATFLVYRKCDGDIIDSMTLGMITNNKIKGLAPFVFVQMDENIYFKYNITCQNTLEQYFSGVVNKNRFLGVLKSMMDTFELAEEYMLEIASFVLEPAHVFVNPDTSEIHFVVLPVINDAEVVIKDYIKELIFRIQIDQTEDSSYFASIISFLNSKQFFSIREFKQLLEDLLKSGSGMVMKENSSMTAKESGQTPRIPTAMPGLTFERVDRTTEESMKLPIKPAESKDVQSCIQEASTEKRGLFSKKKKVKEDKTDKKSKTPKKSLFGKQKTFSAGFTNMDIPGMDVPAKSEHVSIPMQNVSMQKHSVQIQNFGETVDLRAYSEGTTVLNETTVLTDSMPYSSFFINLRTREIFRISKEISRIGKDPMRNDFCIQGNSAVSREHAVIHFQNGQVYIMDNRSTNGTYIDGIRLASGSMSACLEHGMRIRLGDEELEFRMQE